MDSDQEIQDSGLSCSSRLGFANRDLGSRAQELDLGFGAVVLFTVTSMCVQVWSPPKHGNSINSSLAV